MKLIMIILNYISILQHWQVAIYPEKCFETNMLVAYYSSKLFFCNWSEELGYA